jgi:hypothetical protein
VTVFELSNASAACPATYSRKTPPTQEIIAMMKGGRHHSPKVLSLSAPSTLVHFYVSDKSRFCTTAQYTILVCAMRAKANSAEECLKELLLKIIGMHGTEFREVIPQIVMHGTGFQEVTQD